MKKIYLLILFIFIITGCNAEYQITITSKEKSFGESLKLSNLDNSMNVEEIMTKNIGIHYYENYVIFSSINSPDKKYYEKLYENNIFSLTNIDNVYVYSNSAIAKNCFDKFVIGEDYYDYSLIASGFNCFNKYPTLDEVKLTIVIDSAIVSTNLQKLDLNTYTKTITRQNANEEISFIFPLYQVPVNEKIYRSDGDGEGGAYYPSQEEIDNQSSQGNSPSSQEDDVQSSQSETSSSSLINVSSDEDSSKDNTSSSNNIREANRSNILYWIIGVVSIILLVVLIIYKKSRKNNKI